MQGDSQSSVVCRTFQQFPRNKSIAGQFDKRPFLSWTRVYLEGSTPLSWCNELIKKLAAIDRNTQSRAFRAGEADVDSQLMGWIAARKGQESSPHCHLSSERGLEHSVPGRKTRREDRGDLVLGPLC